MSEQRITVAVRIRPPIGCERYEPVCARKADDDQTITISAEETSASVDGVSVFQFDYVFDETDDQVAVYEESVQEMVDHALSGFNATVFTYGQTGSGKTYTILGSKSADGKVTEGSGAFMRVFDDLFTYRESVKDRVHMVITLSALELYVEDVMDLLMDKKKLKLRETPEETITVGIHTVEVHTMADVERNFDVANSFRSVTATKMNDTSSRSHALFFIDIFQIPVEKLLQPPKLSQLIDETGMSLSKGVPGVIKSRIALVDLAGSERVKRSGATGQAMVEAQAINKSLSTLGTVINAMYLQNPHIPFRESKLTKLLKPCFVDTTSRLLLIGQVAPPSNSASESLGTLRFCDRVKGLKAGQVMGFTDPAAEEAFLQSRRVNEELLAEMHILQAQYYYEAVNVRRLAAAKNVPVEQERQRIVAELQAGAADVVARKEREMLEKAERKAIAQRDAEVESFVLHMNSLIEEYEQVAHAVKREKKAQKKLREEQEAEHEVRLHEAKKAKKHRLKMQEAVAEARQNLEALDRELEALDGQIEVVGKERAAGVIDSVDDDAASPNKAMDSEAEETTHGLVESFYSHATEQSRLYSMFVSRLASTRRERSRVRRMKLMSSTLVTDGTLLYDLISFLIDRAVDVSEGDLPLGAKWGWHDVDGLSQRLLCADEMYPPLLPSAWEQLHEEAKPCLEQPHSITFLSSDESDGEHSHHAAESRRIRQIRDAAAAAKAESLCALHAYDEGDRKRETSSGGGSDGDGRDGKKISQKSAGTPTPHAHQSDWMNGQLLGQTPPQDAALGVANTVEDALPVATKARTHRKKKDEAAAASVVSPSNGSGDASTRGAAAASAAHSPEERPGRHGKSKGVPAAMAAGSEDRSSDESGDESSGTESSSSPSESDTGEESPEEAAAAKGAANKDQKNEAHDAARKGRGVEEDALPVDAPNPSYQEKDSRALMKVYDSPTLVQDLIRFLRSGSRMLKHCRRGKPHARVFWVSTQRGKKELFWKEPDSRNADCSCIQLCDVSFIQLGCFGKVFSRHRIPPTDPAFFRAFTIGLKHGGRTVDIVAETLPDYEAWVVGLSHLVGVDPVWGGKIDLTMEVGTDRLTYFESSVCEANYIHPLEYLELKKRVQHVATRTMQVLEEFGKDTARAQAILGGIHPPAVNNNCAVYMTKGELRFLLPDTFDIIRVSRLWMLFQQMNLIYDDNFTPATAFGITVRES
ncbi:putative kinesin [Leishmania mexicana MHOM/GT/2001/U1103]|uniref:Kinesin n=1 Tax=Leishmania mexicana (strain MHOM/GT/2001/U1103) TaxID=929439 RepID=E9B0S3_LEIMU|nr:putative kinesin [Leishmania mexicana MHOM/GT/2001/U1103]CBZ28828.1 putative kinesin [Leishmania mexicana MHOM/GT/2001/U1103]